ncbi:MAG: AI-2E family transporter [Clostridia bacterium]|nr:AI-2E family transporter [Clostridia bacterium]
MTSRNDRSPRLRRHAYHAPTREKVQPASYRKQDATVNGRSQEPSPNDSTAPSVDLPSASANRTSSRQEHRKRAGYIIGIVAACILIFLGVQNIDVVAGAIGALLDILSPLILGFAFALILNVPMRALEKHFWPHARRKALQKLRRPAAFLLSLILIVGILVGIIGLIIPELVKAVQVLIAIITDMVNDLSAMDRAELARNPIGKVLLDIDWNGILKTLQSWLKEQSGSIVYTAVEVVSTLVSGVVDFFIAFVFAVYILFSKETLKRNACRLIRAWLPSKVGEWSIHAASVAGESFRNFISGQTLEAIILGVLCMLGMFLLDLPYAPMIGALVGVTALIPIVGAFVGAGVGAFMILTVSPVKAIIFLAFILILQQLEENLIYPRVMGSRVNLPSIWILAAITVGGAVAGPIGMLLAVPITSTLYVLVKEATKAREKKIAEAVSVIPNDQDAQG